MRHMVVYGSVGGGPAYHEAEDLDGAVRMVEHLRNTQSVTDARIYSLEEVPIEFRAYYRVEVTPPAPAPPVRPPEPELTQEPDEPQAEPAPVLASVVAAPAEVPAETDFMAPTPVLPTQAAGRFGLFSRG